MVRDDIFASIHKHYLRFGTPVMRVYADGRVHHGIEWEDEKAEQVHQDLLKLLKLQNKKDLILEAAMSKKDKDKDHKGKGRGCR